MFYPAIEDKVYEPESVPFTISIATSIVLGEEIGFSTPMISLLKYRGIPSKCRTISTCIQLVGADEVAAYKPFQESTINSGSYAWPFHYPIPIWLCNSWFSNAPAIPIALTELGSSDANEDTLSP